MGFGATTIDLDGVLPDAAPVAAAAVAVPGGLPGALPDAAPGGLAGAVPGALAGAVPDALSGGLPGALPDAFSDARMLEAVEGAVAALSAVSSDPRAYRGLRESTLLELARLSGVARDLATTRGVLVAGEVARRSAPELGSSGLAQRTGFRTAEELIKVTTRATGRDAVTAVKLGRFVAEAAAEGEVDPLTGVIGVVSESWLRPVADALRAGSLSTAAAAAIRSGLGSPSSGASEAELTSAAETLCAEAATLDPDRLFRRARQLRDELDAAGIAVREEKRRAERSLRLTVLPSGMGRLVWELDPETLASVKDVYDRATSPKLGGVRFVDGRRKERADEILADPRTPGQLASDAFAQLLRQGADANPSFLIGSGAPQVRVTITAIGLDDRSGIGRLEGQPDPVSINTVERLVCNGSVVGITFDRNLQPLDVGRDQRLFTQRQKLALAVRDGGCRWPGCDRPPSWTEAHHTRFWARDRGPTDVGFGILLCKHHHLLAHNNQWEIRADGDQFLLIPPAGVDPRRRPRPMPTKSAAMRDLRRDLGRDLRRDLDHAPGSGHSAPTEPHITAS